MAHGVSPFGGRSKRAAWASVLAIAAVALMLRPSAAEAHAFLESSTPANGAIVASSPQQVELHFSESVLVDASSIRLLDQREQIVTIDRPRATGRTVDVRIPKLGNGAYVVTWHVVSDDTHPVRGAFTFRVGPRGNAGEAESLAARALNSNRTPAATSRIATGSRIAALLSIILLVGAAAVSLFVPLTDTARRRCRVIVTAAAATAVVAGGVGLLAYGPLVAGKGLGGFGEWGLLRSTLEVRFGKALSLRTLWLVVLAIALRHGWRASVGSEGQRASTTRDSSTLLAVTSALASVLCLTLAGHASIGRRSLFASAADLGHVLGASVWIGGLAVIAFAVLTRPAFAAAADADGGSAETIASVLAFSKLTVACVVLLTVTGLAQTWRQVGSRRALTSTTYGHLLIAKVAIVAALLLLGLANRRALAGTVAQAGRTGAVDAAVGEGTGARGLLATLRRNVAVETAGGLAIVVITSFLINTPPARDVVTRPVSLTLRAQSILYDITVSPAATGRNDLHVYALDRAGAAKSVTAMTATLDQQFSGVAPIPVRLVRAGPNHFVAHDVTFPFRGQWRIDVTARVDEFTAERAIGQVSVR